MKTLKRIYIEITNQCNLSCSFCADTHRSSTYMERKTFEKIVDEAKGFIKEATLHILGEPLMHPEVVYFVDYLISAGMDVILTTNGTLLSSTNAKLLAERKIKQINISMHADNGILNQEEYLQSIFDYIKLVRQANYEMYFNLRLWNVLVEKNEFILAGINKEYHTQIAMPKNIAEFKKNKSRKLAERIYVNYDSQFEWPNQNLPTVREKGFCYALDSHIGVLSDGTIIPCCLDANGYLSLGNISITSLEQSLSSVRAQKMKQGFAQHNLVEPLCQHCSFIRRFS